MPPVNTKFCKPSPFPFNITTKNDSHPSLFLNYQLTELELRVFLRGVSVAVVSYLLNAIFRDSNKKWRQYESIKKLILENNGTFFNHLHIVVFFILLLFCLFVCFACSFVFVFTMKSVFLDRLG